MAGVAGRSGRKRKPDSIKILQGTYRSDRQGAPELKPSPDGAPVKPEFALPEAGAFWDAYVPELVRMGVAAAVDAPRLQLLCESWALLRRATDRLNEDPFDKVARCAQAEYSRQFTAATSEFGLTPSARSRIQVQVKATEPPFKPRNRD